MTPDHAGDAEGLSDRLTLTGGVNIAIAEESMDESRESPFDHSWGGSAVSSVARTRDTVTVILGWSTFSDG